MVNFWKEARKLELQKVTQRIQFAEKQGLGKMAMEEKQRKQKLQRLIEENDK